MGIAKPTHGCCTSPCDCAGQPLLRFQILASAIAGWYLNRQHESFDRGVLLAIGVSMPGAVLLALDRKTLLRVLDLPIWFAPVLGWRRPGQLGQRRGEAHR